MISRWSGSVGLVVSAAPDPKEDRGCQIREPNPATSKARPPLEFLISIFFLVESRMELESGQTGVDGLNSASLSLFLNKNKTNYEK